MTIKHIIVQAGGLGTRLEALTTNKPKCLVSVNNLPIIFYLFNQFPKAKFYIIADYKSDVLEKYLTTFATNIDFCIEKTNFKGTSSGIANMARKIENNPSVMLIWSDLILDDSFLLQNKEENYVGISVDFECRWSFINNQFIKNNSKENGVAGLFLFKNKQILHNVPENSEFVAWLANQNIDFNRLELLNAKEIGTINSYDSAKKSNKKCRPFNEINFYPKYVEKIPLSEYGKDIALKETSWYKHVSGYGFSHIPKIYRYEPLRIEKIIGKNIYEYQNFSDYQKEQILKKIIKKLNDLHNLDNEKIAVESDCINNYLEKTFERMSVVKNLIPFANQKEIVINGKKYKNALFFKDEIYAKIIKHIPNKFHIIHGDPTFSNIILRDEDVDPVFIDPRGYFGSSLIYGDRDYDFAKLYYSIIGNYDQFNNHNFSLDIREAEVFLHINSNNWSQLESFFFNECGSSIEKIKLLHSLIWLSLCTYAWDDYDSICASFYNGLTYLNELI